MSKEKIAVLTDSGNDLGQRDDKNLFVVPLLINIDGDTFIDGVDITLMEVFEKLDDHKVTTSLPSADSILETLDKIKEEGYTHVIVNTISSKLSGTNNFLRMLTEDYEGLEFHLVDTKNISKAAGYSSIRALELINEGNSFADVKEKLDKALVDHKVFFTVGTVEYLRRGGRIGLVAGAIANLLSIKPVISCNPDGVYHSVKKTRGFNKAITQTIDLSEEFVKGYDKYKATILVGEITDRIQTVIDSIKLKFKDAYEIEIKEVTPALAIHTGPEAFGLAISRY